MRNTKNLFLLLLTAIIWGFAFTAQKTGMNHIGPFAFNGIRSFIGALFLVPCSMLLDHFKSPAEREKQKSLSQKQLLIGGLACGICLFLASSAQQYGIQFTTAGKAGFITACYIIIVPILGIFFRKSCSLFVWISTFIALAGLYFLCITESFSIELGDLYVLACALLFSIHILVIDYYAPKCDCVRLSCIQFFITGILCMPPMLILEGMPSAESILLANIPLLYAGVMSCGVAYTLQILGQRNVNPTIASLIMSLESTFAVIGGWLLIDERLSQRQLIGCVLMFFAIMLSQVPSHKKA